MIRPFKQITSFLKALYRAYTKSPIYFKIVLFLIVLYFLTVFYNNNKPYTEGFTQNEKFIMKEGTEVYDDFYADIYDELVLDPKKNEFEIGEIMNITQMKPQKSRVLDIGSGRGHHVGYLQNNNYDVVGIDISPTMIQKAKSKYPNAKFEVGDVTKSMLYEPDTFTHIQCLYFTIYYIDNKRAFFENCYKWLKPGGYLAIHLVNRDKFNPIVNAADPLLMVSPQKYAKKRITNSLVKFKDFQYKANFSLDKSSNKAYFDETFKDDVSNHVRKNKHIFYMNSQKEILSIAKGAGFNLLGKIDLTVVQYEYQYIYILQKPK